MGKERQLSPAKRASIISLHLHTSKTHRDIAHDLNVNHSTVTRIIHLYKNTGKTAPATRSGRPKVTTEKVDRHIRREAIKDPFITANQIKTKLRPHTQNVSISTIKRRLFTKFKMPATKPRKKPMLTKVMRQKRINFCKKYQRWTMEQWRTVLFSDESTFQQFCNTQHHVRRPAGTSPLNPRYTIKTVKHSPSVMVWGCFSYFNRGALTFLAPNERMNADRYINILEEKLIQFMGRCQTSIFQQDNAPCHAAKKTLNWFRSNNVELLDWPSNSPDINPIENIWQIVKRKVAELKPSNIDELKAEITRVWCTEVTVAYCNHLVDSMPQRMAAVLKACGYPTKY